MSLGFTGSRKVIIIRTTIRRVELSVWVSELALLGNIMEPVRP